MHIINNLLPKGLFDFKHVRNLQRFDDTEDALLDPTEFLKFVEHNETLRNATDDLNQDLEEDTLLRLVHF